MKFSHSRVDTYVKCPYKYFLKYIKNLRTLDDYKADNPLKIGTMLHTAIEKDLDIATKEYYDSCPIITDEHVTESFKIEVLLSRIKKMLPVGEHEVKIENDYFIGFIDLLVPIDENTYDLYDFKYSNNINSYLESGQLHEYKYFFEKTNPGKKIRKLYYLFVPKSKLRLKKNEDIYKFRQRIIQDLQMKKVQLIEVEYNPNKVIEFLINAINCINALCYPKTTSDLCNWCEYKKYCLDEIDYEITRGGYYEGIFDHEIVHEDSAYEYAKYHLDRLPDKDQKDFVEWFFSGNWIKREVDENDSGNNNDNNLFDSSCFEKNG